MSASIIIGRWRIIAMDGREASDAVPMVKPFIQFDPQPARAGEFGFERLHGFIDYRLLERDGKPAVEWTWKQEATDSPGVWGRGWAVVEDGSLKGRFFVHQGHEWSFVGVKVGRIEPGRRDKSASGKPTPLQARYLAFISHYTHVNGQAPSELDMRAYFRTSPPTIHQMVLTLERRGFIQRTPGMARSIRVLLPWEA